MSTEMDDEEWEYEYDYENPEVFYVPVDFSTHSPHLQVTQSTRQKTSRGAYQNRQVMNARKARANHRKYDLSDLNNDLDDQDPQDPAPEADVDDESPSPSPPPPPQQTSPTPAAAQQDEAPDKDPPERARSMQILDLDTANPLIVYNSQFYTCHWATDIGTSLFITPHQEERDPKYPALRSHPVLDILAKSRARLIAVPARLVPKASPLPADTAAASRPSTPGPSTTPPPPLETVRTAQGDTVEIFASGRMRIGIPSDAPANKQAQRTFLERWSELKARKGRDDVVPVKTMRSHRVPEDWERIRRDWAEKEARGEGLVPGADAAAWWGREEGGGGGVVFRGRKRRNEFSEKRAAGETVRKRTKARECVRMGTGIGMGTTSVEQAGGAAEAESSGIDDDGG